VFLCELGDARVFEEGRPCRAERAVGGDVDAFLLAEVYDLLLGEERVVLDLVGGGGDCGLGEELLEVFDRVVCDADGLDFVRVGFGERLEVLPRVDVRDAVVDVAGAVFELGEERVVS
jgi:hypothetical protein